MTTGLKTLAIIGTGAVLALGVSNSEPTSPSTNTSSSIIAPKEEVAPAVKPKVVTPSIKPVTKPVSKTPATKSKPVSNCHPGYSGCLKMNAGDYDCAGGSGNGPNYTGRVRVYDSDPFGLDRDKDGIGCE